MSKEQTVCRGSELQIAMDATNHCSNITMEATNHCSKPAFFTNKLQSAPFQYRPELVDGVGVDVARYDSSCTHVVVSGRVFDEPVCVAARNDGKILVMELWIDDSLGFGMLADSTKVFLLKRSMDSQAVAARWISETTGMLDPNYHQWELSQN